MLTGTAVAGERHIAFLKEVSGGKSRVVRQGEQLNGVLVADGQRRSRQLDPRRRVRRAGAQGRGGPKTTTQPAPPAPPGTAVRRQCPCARAARGGAAGSAAPGRPRLPCRRPGGRRITPAGGPASAFPQPTARAAAPRAASSIPPAAAAARRPRRRHAPQAHRGVARPELERNSSNGCGSATRRPPNDRRASDAAAIIRGLPRADAPRKTRMPRSRPASRCCWYRPSRCSDVVRVCKIRTATRRRRGQARPSPCRGT